MQCPQTVQEAVLFLAIRDLKKQWRRTPKYLDGIYQFSGYRYYSSKQELLRFFATEWFVDLCDFQNLDHREVMRLLGVEEHVKAMLGLDMEDEICYNG